MLSTSSVKVIKRLVVAFASLVALIFLFSVGSTARAAERPEIHFTVSPSTLRLNLTLGQKTDGSYLVKNTGKQELDLRVMATPLKYEGENYNPIYETDWSRALSANWVTYDQDKFHLKPDETFIVNFHVNVPKDVPSGGQYMALMTEEVPNKPAQGSGIVSNKRIALKTSSYVMGETHLVGKILTQKADFWQPDGIESLVRVENTGNIDFSITTSMTVKSWFSRKIKYQTKPVTLDVLPDSTRAIEMEWSNANIGLYRVTIESKYLDQVKITEHTVLVLPYWLIALLIIVIFAIFVLWLRRYNKKDHKTKVKVKL
jgi:hypothetical protein